MNWSQWARQSLRSGWLWCLGLLTLVALLACPHLLAWHRFRAGKAAADEYQNETARAQLQNCLRTWPGNVTARLLAARACRRLGDLEAANQHLDEARQQVGDAEAEEIAFEFALLRAAMGDLRMVEETLQERLVKQAFLGPLIWEALADGYRRMCRLREAITCLDQWLVVEPSNGYAYFLRGEVYRQLGTLNRAREEYRRAVELDPRLHLARRYLARCLVQVGRFQEALDHLETLRGQWPDDGEILVHAARCRHDLGDKDQASRLLDQALAMGANNTRALKERGRQALAADRYAEAETWLRRAVEIQPFDYEGQWALCQALQSQSKAAAAKTQLVLTQNLKDRLERINTIETREMTLRPFDAILHAELGQLLLSVGHQESGLRWLHSAVQLDPRQSAAQETLASHYKK